MSFADLPALNALLNSVSALCLTAGYVAVRRGRCRRHRAYMLAAVAASTLFLASYVTYHVAIGSVPYPRHDWTRGVYFAILVPHVVLAGLMVPFILAALALALRGRFQRHRRLARWVWPVWMFVSVSGVAIYWMLYRLAGPTAAAR